ncbi:MAG: hypothetical protein P8Z75_01640 [Gammaproteobacteria bacterium]|jgi:hypothetical protein
MNSFRLLQYGILIASMLSVLSGVAHADRRHDREDRDRYDRNRVDQRDRHDRYDRRDTRYFRAPPSKDYRLDRRYDHDRYYPRPGHSIVKLPPRHVIVRYHDDRYYYHAGIWYRPVGTHFVVVVPPIGLVVPILPAFYTTIWFNGIPYYYANSVYYMWDPARDGYVVTEPPPQVNNQEPVLTPDQLYIYPKQGQSEKQQADDRFTCYQWSVKQTGYDPTQPPQGISQDVLNQKREDYRRAMRACLEGRGYSVR